MHCLQQAHLEIMRTNACCNTNTDILQRTSLMKLRLIAVTCSLHYTPQGASHSTFVGQSGLTQYSIVFHTLWENGFTQDGTFANLWHTWNGGWVSPEFYGFPHQVQPFESHVQCSLTNAFSNGKNQRNLPWTVLTMHTTPLQQPFALNNTPPNGTSCTAMRIILN